MHRVKFMRLFAAALIALLMVLTSAPYSQPSSAEADGPAIRSGFSSGSFAGNDDGSTDSIGLGFNVNFFGRDYSSLFINNNGNLTFDQQEWTYTPFDLTSTGRVIVAPFFADVDTRVGNTVTYGSGTVGGRPAFGVNWPGVGCYNVNNRVLNYFQVLLINRDDVALGDFDIEFNYDQIQWETGMASAGDSNCLGGNSARVGYSNGTGASGTYFELPGSGIPGSFIDSNLSTGLVRHSLNSSQLGRYVFEVRGGRPLQADLSVDKSASPQAVPVGAQVNYHIQLTNNGPDTATGLVLTDALPPSLSGAAPSWNAPITSCVVAGSVVTCYADSLSAGNSATINIHGTATAGGVIANTASVTANQVDPVPTNNSSTASVTVSADATPPVITPSVSPAPNAQGWNFSSPSVSWTLNDPESGVVSATGCDDSFVGEETAGRVFTCSATNGAGLSASQSVTVRFDHTQPTITAAHHLTADPSVSIPAGGWYSGSVSVEFTCVDALSGIASCSPEAILSGEGANQGATGTATDRAGHSNMIGVSGINIDRTAPTSAATPSPAPNAAGWNNTEVTVSLSALDNPGGSGVAWISYSISGAQTGSGVLPAAAGSFTVSANGVTTVTFSATDLAGNVEAAKTLAVRVDQIAPTVTAGTLTRPNAALWFNSPVAVHFTCSDAHSGIGGCSPNITVTYDGANSTATGGAIDNAGNSASVTLFGINIDTTPPTISGAALTPPNAAGWHNAPVIVRFTCSDTGSGIASCPADVTLSSDGANQSVTGTATNNAGTSSSVTVSGINIDTAPPVVTVTRDPAPNASGWNNTTVNVTFAATDSLSGLDTIPIEIVALSLEGPNQTVSRTYADKAGNSTISTVSGINIDTTPPSAAASAVPVPNAAGWNNTDVTVNLSALDNAGGSGPKEISYSLSGAQTGSGVFSPPLGALTISANGTTTVTYFARDVAGNQEAPQSLVVRVDKVAPTISGAPTTPANAAGWYNGAVTIDFSCSDAGSGIATCSGDTTLSSQGANQSTSGSATDSAGNSASATVSDINIDKYPPTVIVTHEPEPNDAGWYNSVVNVTFAASDALSGLDTIPIEIVALSLQGADQSVTRTFTDRAGNSTTSTVSGINIDTTPPTSSASATPAPNAAGWNNTDVTANLSATDEGGSGVKEIRYTLSGAQTDSGVLPASGGPVAISANGRTTVSYYATDVAGNQEETKTLVVRVDKLAPSASATAAPTPNSAGWNNTDVTVSFSGSDYPSGIASCSSPVTLSGEGSAQSASGTCTDNAGNVSAPATASGIRIDKTAPVISGAAIGVPNADGWYAEPVTVDFVCSDAGSGIDTCPADVTLSAEGAGQSASGTATDKAGNSASATVSGINIDTTPPAIAGAPATSANAAGWYSVPVTVQFACSDSLSGIAFCPAAVTLGSEGANQSVPGMAVDRAGNISETIVSDVDIDQTAPRITGAATTSPNAAGWYSTSVTIHFTCSDALSGIAVCPADVTLSSEGANQSVAGTAIDRAGNSASYTVSGINIDKTRPAATAAAAPAPNANGWNKTDVSVSFSGVDALSGVAACSAPVVLSAEGADQSASGTCLDKAGNVSLPATAAGINIDKTAPSTGMAYYAATIAGFYPPVVIAVLSPSDQGGSGLEATQYSLNGGAAIAYTAPFSISSGITTTVAAGSSDRAGNVEISRTETISRALGFPALISAVPNAELTSVRIRGELSAAPNTAFPVSFFANANCTMSGFGNGRTLLGTVPVTTTATGEALFDQSFAARVEVGSGVSASTVNAAGSQFATCTDAVAYNSNFFFADRLQFHSPARATGRITRMLESLWYRFPVQPLSKVMIKLTGPAGLVVSAHRDPRPYYHRLTQGQDAVRASAEALGQDFIGQDFIGQDFIGQDFIGQDFIGQDFIGQDFIGQDFIGQDFIGQDFIGQDFIGQDFIGQDFIGQDFIGQDFIGQDFIGQDFIGQDFIAQDFIGQDFIGQDFIPADLYGRASWPAGVVADTLPFQPGAYAGARMRSMLGYSADRYSTAQTLAVNTRDSVEDFYVRVMGPVSLQPFNLEITVDGDACQGLGSVSGTASTAQVIPGLKTLILTDSGRLTGTTDEKAAALARLNALKLRPEVAGTVLDLAAHARVVSANLQADAIPGCTTAKNIVAAEIKAIIDAYRAVNPGIQYIVLAGGAGVIPYNQTLDTAGLANESSYYPPVRALSASEAGLANNLVQGQDFYGASDRLELDEGHYYYIPDLAVGRLVDTAADIVIAVDAAIATNLVVTPRTGLVTGYDFIADAALAAKAEIEAAIAAPAQSLIQPAGLPPTDPTAWHAEDLRAKLLGATPPAFSFIAAHFDAGRALAADYQTTLSAAEVSASAADLTDAILIAIACHAGYTIPYLDVWSGFSPEPDWAKAFLRKRAAGFIASTGYAYGDSDLIEYTERLGVDLVRHLRTGQGPISLGQALVRAKRDYQARLGTPVGIHEKTLVEMVVYGLPMMKVDFPGQRIVPPTSTSIVDPSDLTPEPQGTAGRALGLHEANVDISPQLTETTRLVYNPSTNSTTVVTYLSGKDGVEANPGQPVLPKHLEDVSVSDYVLRSVAFRGGTFSDFAGIVPLMSAATTEIAQDHNSFASDVFYPPQTWHANFADALSGGATRLVLLPAQLKSTIAGSTDDITVRQLISGQFRLYYLGGNWPDDPIVARAAVGAPPSIAGAVGLPSGNGVRFQVRVPPDQVAGIHAVWVLYNSGNQWVPFDLTPNALDRSLWEGTKPDLAPAGRKFMVQAVNGAGLAALDTNRGAYYEIAPAGPVVPPLPPEATTLSLAAPAVTGYLGEVSLTARLVSGAVPLAGQTIYFSIGGRSARATTDGAGNAAATVRVALPPGTYGVGATFRGAPGFRSSSASPATIAVVKRATTLTLSPPSASAQYSDNPGIVAELRDVSGNPLRGGYSVFFVVSDGVRTYRVTSGTDYLGNALLGAAALPAGSYQVSARFLGDLSYEASESAGSVTLTAEDATVAYTGDTVIRVSTALSLTAVVTQAADSWPGDLRLAQVRYRVINRAGAVVFSGTAPVAYDGISYGPAVSGLATDLYYVDAQVVGGYFTSEIIAPLTIAVYDPNAGFISGGGWTSSVPGSYPAGPTAKGKLTASFNARYQPSATVPSGQAEIQLQGTTLNFHSTSYDWLVITGSRAFLRGSGTIGGSGSFGFLAAVIDAPSNKQSDLLRIRIWSTTTGVVVYDNLAGALDGADARAAVTGSLTLH